MPKLNVCFNGCSFTFGDGFAENARDQYIYDRLVSKKFNFNQSNIAKNGSSNYNIFMRSAAAILSNKYNIVFTQWSALNRIWFSPGPDAVFCASHESDLEFQYRELYLSPKQSQQFRNTLLMMNHDYQNILDLIDYCKILNQLAQINLTKVVFINGLIPWQTDLNNTLASGTDLHSSLSDYTKSILDFDNRQDEEIILFFSKLQKKFTELDQSNWVNLFDSFKSKIVDAGPEGHHPGIISHQWMADQVSDFLTTNITV